MFYSVPLLSTQTVTAPSTDTYVFVNMNISSIFGPVFFGPPFSAHPCSVTSVLRPVYDWSVISRLLAVHGSCFTESRSGSRSQEDQTFVNWTR